VVELGLSPFVALCEANVSSIYSDNYKVTQRNTKIPSIDIMSRIQ